MTNPAPINPDAPTPGLQFLKEFHDYYAPQPEIPEILGIPAFPFMMIDGQGNPTSPEFGEQGKALFLIVETLRSLYRGPDDLPYEAGPLEAVWWTESGEPMTAANIDHWRWTAMIMTPGLGEVEFNRATMEVWSEHNFAPLKNVRLESLQEGEIVQSLHVGHPAKKQPLINKIWEHAASHGFQPYGKYHEIYLSNPLHVPLDRCQTIVRQPIRKEQGL